MQKLEELTRICPVCGEEFKLNGPKKIGIYTYRPRGIWRRKKYCTEECRTKAAIQRRALK